jgi:hypothetical protein
MNGIIFVNFGELPALPDVAQKEKPLFGLNFV